MEKSIFMHEKIHPRRLFSCENVFLCSNGSVEKLTQNKTSIRIGDDILIFDKKC